MASTNETLDLDVLPAPQVIEEYKYETILARQRQTFMDEWAKVRAAHPDEVLPAYDVELLETDPAMIGNQAETYRETLIRGRINDAAKANLLAYAIGSDLDHLAAFYGVVRMARENDARLKIRVILAIQGRSTGGTAERYKYVAMTASIDVEAVEVYTEGKSPLIHVAVFSTAVDGVATPQLLETVRLALNDPKVIMVNDTIEVRSGVLTVVNIEADYWLLPEAADNTSVAMESSLRTAWASIQTLGRDLVPNWWISRLMISGVHDVKAVLPIGAVVAPKSEAIAIGSVKLNFKGRAF